MGALSDDPTVKESLTVQANGFEYRLDPAPVGVFLAIPGGSNICGQSLGPMPESEARELLRKADLLKWHPLKLVDEYQRTTKAKIKELRIANRAVRVR